MFLSSYIIWKAKQLHPVNVYNQNHHKIPCVAFHVAIPVPGYLGKPGNYNLGHRLSNRGNLPPPFTFPKRHLAMSENIFCLKRTGCYYRMMHRITLHNKELTDQNVDNAKVKKPWCSTYWLEAFILSLLRTPWLITNIEIERKHKIHSLSPFPQSLVSGKKPINHHI